MGTLPETAVTESQAYTKTSSSAVPFRLDNRRSVTLRFRRLGRYAGGY